MEVRVWIEASAVAWARETPAYGFQREEPSEGGSVFVYDCWDLRRLLPWLLGWGSSARVLSPPGVVERMRREAEALAEARVVMNYFGFRNVIIDNAIHPDDRKVFYALHDAGLLQSFWETVPLMDGRNWRIFYWSLSEADIDRVLAEREPLSAQPLYTNLPEEAWGRSARPA